jgi:hypothetical protein
MKDLRAALLHDDRKPLRHWLNSQARYAELEGAKLMTTSREDLNLKDRIRRWLVVAPAATLCYCLIVRGGIFDGWRGFYYAFQRSLAELMLSLYLLDSRCTFSESTRITAMLRRPSSKTAD